MVFVGLVTLLNDLIQQRIEFLSLKQSICIHRVPVRHDLSCSLPIAERIRGNVQILSRIRDSQVVAQLCHVIPFADSEERVAKSGLPPETLIEVGNDHRLADEESLSVMLWACNLLASGKQLPWLESNQQQSPAIAPSNGQATSQEDASYICDACGEEIVIPLDLSEGSVQTYVEDCPVCCRANTIHVQIDNDGEAQVWAEPEQDYD